MMQIESKNNDILIKSREQIVKVADYISEYGRDNHLLRIILTLLHDNKN